MPYNGLGTFVRAENFTNDAAAGIKIRADRMDIECDGYATGLSTAICKDGQTVITANLPMAGFRHTGVGDGVATTDYASYGQLQNTFAGGSLYGLTLSTAGASATFGIATGRAADSTNAIVMALTSAYTKTTSAWAVGTGNGSLDTGAIGNSAWYHVYLIQRTDTNVVDILISLSATAPTMPASYTLKRRIGAMKTDGSAQWTKFVQVGDEFLWDTPPQDISTTTLTTSAATFTLTAVPTGVKVTARLRGWASHASANAYILVHSLDEAVQVANSPVGNATVITQVGAQAVGFIADIRTNTSAQVRGVSSAAGNATINAMAVGWRDDRGRV